MNKKLILKYALLNAVQHDGKANVQAVLGKIISENPKVRNEIKEIIPEIKKIVAEVNSLSVDEQKKKVKELGLKIEKKKVEEERELPPLPNVKKYKKIVMRMAPFPSGPLHIGNARMALLNDEYVKKYKGKLLLVIDDTIGSEAKIPTKEAYPLVKEGLKWLGVKWHKIIYKSDRMKLFYEWAEKLTDGDLLNEYELSQCMERLTGCLMKLGSTAGALEALKEEIEHNSEVKQYGDLDKIKTQDTAVVKANARNDVSKIRKWATDFRNYFYSAQSAVVTAQSRLKRLTVEKGAKKVDYCGEAPIDKNDEPDHNITENDLNEW